jgi:hypothetical protein
VNCRFVLFLMFACDSSPQFEEPAPAQVAPLEAAPPEPEPISAPVITKVKRPTLDGVTLGEPTVSPSQYLDPVDARMSPYLPKLAYCYNEARQNRPQLAGSIVVKFAAGRDNLKHKPRIESDTVNDEALAFCITSRMWKFGKITPDDEVWATYPLHFDPLDASNDD